tara:strand:+ start:2987 stop:4168 length:1182 start_codon:yes stop_codon:yes gene_type:complete
MKNRIILIIAFMGLFIYACSEEESVGQQPLDVSAPGAISNVKIINIAGGALLTFTPPKDEDLLYTKAIYSRKDGVYSESKASLYTDTLRIEGFGNTDDRQVKLVAVDRSRNESEAVEVTISPLEPPVNVIAQSLEVSPDFGGITATWENEGNAEISIVIQEKDTLLEEFIPLETYYTKTTNGKFSVYGLDTIPKVLNVHIEDRWENRSEVKSYTITPIFETEFKKSQFGFINLPGDGPHHGGWTANNIWNDTANPDGYSSLGGQGIWPQSLTIDLGVIGLLSRITVYQRIESNNYVYAEGNLKKFEVWGSETLDTSGSWDSWTKLGDFESIKPSDLPFGQFSDEDYAVASNGENFSFPSSNPKVRYLRIIVTETWAGGDNFQIMELDIFGDNR